MKKENPIKFQYEFMNYMGKKSYNQAISSMDYEILQDFGTKTT